MKKRYLILTGMLVMAVAAAGYADRDCTDKSDTYT